jgi:hypothetical protein
MGNIAAAKDIAKMQRMMESKRLTLRVPSITIMH